MLKKQMCNLGGYLLQSGHSIDDMFANSLHVKYGTLHFEPAMILQPCSNVSTPFVADLWCHEIGPKGL